MAPIIPEPTGQRPAKSLSDGAYVLGMHVALSQVIDVIDAALGSTDIDPRSCLNEVRSQLVTLVGGPDHEPERDSAAPLCWVAVAYDGTIGTPCDGPLDAVVAAGTGTSCRAHGATLQALAEQGRHDVLTLTVDSGRVYLEPVDTPQLVIACWDVQPGDTEVTHRAMARSTAVEYGWIVVGDRRVPGHGWILTGHRMPGAAPWSEAVTSLADAGDGEWIEHDQAEIAAVQADHDDEYAPEVEAEQREWVAAELRCLHGLLAGAANMGPRPALVIGARERIRETALRLTERGEQQAADRLTSVVAMLDRWTPVPDPSDVLTDARDRVAVIIRAAGFEVTS